MKKLVYYLILVLVVTFSGCKDTEDAVEATKVQLIDRLEKLDVPEKMKTSQNEYAKEAVGYLNEVKGISSYFDYLTVPDDAEYESNKSTLGGDTYYWGYDGFEMWETITETSSKNIWQVDVNAGAGRLKYIVAEEMKDGSSGFMEIYDFTQEVNEWIYRYEWSFDSAGNATLLWTWAGETFEYEIKSNVDLSGSAKYYMGGELIYDFMWNSDGSGSCTTSMFGFTETVTWSASDL